jgi:DNA-binding MarR family transcriptional regulator
MKPLAVQSDGTAGGDDCVAQVLATVPMIMRAIRHEMRRHRPSGLSVPQFRAMGIIYRHGGISLSRIADHMGLTLPTVSKMMDTLVRRELVMRETSPDDRRCLTLKLTEQGKSEFDAADKHAQEQLAETLKSLSPQERDEVTRAMQAIRRAFSPAE